MKRVYKRRLVSPPIFPVFEPALFLFALQTAAPTSQQSTSRNSISDPSSGGAGLKDNISGAAESSPAESRRAEHARCQPLSLNLMPLSPPPPPPVESNLAERRRQRRQQRFVSSSAGEHYLPLCLCYTSTPCRPPSSSHPPLLVRPSQSALLSIPRANSDALNHSTPQPGLPSATEAHQVLILSTIL